MKFSIRDLFLVTLVVALGLGWLLDHWRLGVALSETQEALSETQETEKRCETLLKQVTKENFEIAEQLGNFDLRLNPDGKIERLPSSSPPAPNPPKP